MARSHIYTEIRQMMMLAWPLMLAQLAQQSLSFIDTLMVGRLGQLELASMAVASSLFFVIVIVLSGILIAVNPMVSQAYGADDKQQVSLATSQGLWLALVLALPAFFLLQHGSALLTVLGQEQQVAQLGGAYLAAIAWGLFPSLGLSSLRGFLEGIANPRPVMLITLLGVVANIFFNQALMFGRFGFPALGLTGTGWATTLVYWLMFLAALLYVQLSQRSYRVLPSLGQINLPMMRELLRIGLPIGLTLGFEVSMFATVTVLMGNFGLEALAAHQIAQQTAATTFMLPLGLSIATSVRVGQAVGKKDMRSARRAGLIGMVLAVAVMCLSALAYLLFPRAIIGLYVDLNDPQLAPMIVFATRFFAFAAMFQLVDGLQVSATGALRGLKDTRIPMFISLLCYWAIGISSGLWLAFRTSLGGAGLWLGLVFGLSAAALLMSWRFVLQTRDSASLLKLAKAKP